MESAPTAPRRLILGSASPRRAALLRQLGVDFRQIVSPEAEPEPDHRAPVDFVLHSAEAKARAVARVQPPRPDTLIIAADTVVVLDARILGKPRDAADAAAMLGRLSGRIHEVYTGMYLLRPGHPGLEAAECTRVTMGSLDARDIAWYVSSGEPLDKAGAYAIQGLGARFIERIEGCYYNVVGLPLARLCALLKQAGYDFDLPPSSGAEG